jgi:glyoxylase-like metal-dependent hydrolase (beta-lactamase superfamily II)
MHVAENVHHFDSGPFNWYLIEEQGKLTLVDAGFPGHYRVLKKGLEQLGKSIRDIEAIVLTHSHADHIGFAEKVRKQTGVPVYVHANDAAMARKPLQLPWWGLLSNAWRPYTATMLGVAVINGVFTLPHLTKVETIADGQRLDIPGKPVILHTPGHTDGEICVYLENSNTLISGDTIVTRNLLTGALGTPQITNPVLTKDYRQAMRSLDLLRELGEVTILPGHGNSWKGNMNDAIDTALANAKR